MSLHRFFVEDVAADRAFVRREEFAHMQRVMRMKTGEEIIALDGLGGIWMAKIAAMETEEAEIALMEALPSTEPKARITIYQALPKGDKLDGVLQKCTELGAARFVLLQTRYCVSKPSGIEKKLVRWQRIVKEAAKQSCRAVLPQVQGICALEDIAGFGEDCLLWLDEEGRVPLKTVLPGHGARIGIIIGPEGGWSESERAMLADMGAQNTWLGPRILRTETAGMACLAAALFALGDMGE